MIRIPNTDKKTTQTNISDNLGSLWASFNIDLVDNPGSIRLGSRMVLNMNSVDDSDLGVPIGFRWFKESSTDRIFSVAGSYVWKNAGLPSDTFAQDSTSGTPTTCSSDYSDIEVFNGELHVTTNSSTQYYMDSSGAWQTVSSFGNTSTPHMLCPFGGRLYMTDLLSKIISMDISHTKATSGQYTIQLGNSDSNVITFIRPSASRIWIGTVNTRGGNGYVHEWDGSSSQVTKSYRLEAAGALSCVIKDDIPYIIDTNGNLAAWNGGNFQIIDSLKVDPRLFKNALSSKNNRFIHPNGMAIVKNRINILINTELNSNGTPVIENCPAGVWEYDPNIGLYHKYSLGLSKSDGTITDYGAFRISQAGGLAEANIPSTGSSRDGTFLAGAAYFTDATTTKNGIWYDNQNENLQKAGYIATVKLPSSQVTDVWQKIWLAYSKLLNSADRIVVKYRTEKPAPVEGTITWTSTTTFTVPNSSVVVSNYWTSGIGGEVEVLRGIGAGRCSHITNAVLNTGTWTVTVEDAFTGATSGTATARFQSWKKAGVISDQTSQFKDFGLPMGINSPWIEIKVWMLFTGDSEIDAVIAQSIPNIIAQAVPPKLLKP